MRMGRARALVCFEAALFAASYTKLPLAAVRAAEACRDPLFHIFPNAIRLCLEDGRPDITFASFQHRDEALQLLTRCLGALEPPSC